MNGSTMIPLVSRSLLPIPDGFAAQSGHPGTHGRRGAEGVRGAGMAVHLVNPHLDWNGCLEPRRVQAAALRPLRLVVIEDGASDEGSAL